MTARSSSHPPPRNTVEQRVNQDILRCGFSGTFFEKTCELAFEIFSQVTVTCVFVCFCVVQPKAVTPSAQ